MSMKDPCAGCSEAYGHQGVCPEIKPEHRKDWQRGKDDAAAGRASPDADESNAAYMLGRKMHEFENSSRCPKPRRRPVRVPLKSEPRMAAVTSIARDT